MPTGQVNIFFGAKDFGFNTPDDGGEDVFFQRKVHNDGATVLPVSKRDNVWTRSSTTSARSSTVAPFARVLKLVGVLAGADTVGAAEAVTVGAVEVVVSDTLRIEGGTKMDWSFEDLGFVL